MLIRSPRIASVAGRNVRLPMIATKITPIVPIAIDRKIETSIMNRPGDRDHHRETAEEDRPAGRAAGGLDRRAAWAGPARRSDPEAGDHEQRVVDRDGEADQHDQLGRVRAGRRDELAEDAEDAEGREQRRHGQDERDDRGDERAERDEQDDERQADRDERPVEAAVDQVRDVLAGQRLADRVDDEPAGCWPRSRRSPARTGTRWRSTVAWSPVIRPTIRTADRSGDDEARPWAARSSGPGPGRRPGPTRRRR